MTIPIHWNSTYFIFVVGFGAVGEAMIGPAPGAPVQWVPENVHLNKSEDGEVKRSDSDGEKR